MKKADIIGISIMVGMMTILGIFLYALVTAHSVNNDTFVIVREHDAGDDPSDDWHAAHSYSLYFRIAGPSNQTKISDTYSKTAFEAKNKLRNILTDELEEYNIIEYVNRKDL